jgi:hypothetical protein
MRKHLFAILTALTLASILPFMTSPVSAENASSSGTITAYYFHGTFRCSTCNKMEKYAKEVIEKDFKDELASGKLVFRSVNVESKGNEHYTKDYQLYTKALILSSVKDGKEVRSKNLDKIWEYVRNKKKYEAYVRDEVAAFLKEA